MKRAVRADPTLVEAYGQTCTAASSTGEASLSQCGRDWGGPYPYQGVFNTIAPPNWKHPSCAYGGGFGLCADRSGAFPARSRHPGVANHGMGDGSVRSVSETVDLIVYQQAGARNDGGSSQLP